jgi:hypothetical protein
MKTTAKTNTEKKVAKPAKLQTEKPLAEKDEVKQAEDKQRKKS